MNQEQFISKREELENIIRAKRNELYELEKEYVATNQPYPVGTKLKVTISDEHTINNKAMYAIVRGYELCGDSVKPVLAKINKDGSMHKTANYWLGWWRKPVIEVCND